MSRITMFLLALLFILAGAGCTTRAGEPGQLDAATLRAWASRPWDKAALMQVTVEVGRYRGMPVIAEHPCADVCPQYTVRIIHYRLPPSVSCASVGGVEKEVLVPFAITVRSETVCVPDALVASGLYYGR
jgi:hypothetical protein